MNYSMIKVLIVVTSHAQLGNTGKATGYYLPEVTHPYEKLQKFGVQIDIASPQGGLAPMDERSRDLKDAVNRKLLNDPQFMKKITHTLKLKNIQAKDYKAVIFAGGHGTMWDFRDSQEVQKLSQAIYESCGIVAAVCHGPAALLDVKLSNGQYLIQGKAVTGFSNAEEAAVELTSVMPFLLEDEFEKRGAQFTAKPLWQENVVVDGRLVTGQNPASAAAVGEAVMKGLMNKKKSI